MEAQGDQKLTTHANHPAQGRGGGKGHRRRQREACQGRNQVPGHGPLQKAGWGHLGAGLAEKEIKKVQWPGTQGGAQDQMGEASRVP